MPADIVNLRRARKAKARAEREADAAANRRLFGRSKGEKRKDEAERVAAERRIEAHRLERNPDGDN
jgi:hypothetical protein